MAEFEWELVRSFNRFFEENGIDAIAYRLKQARFSAQPIDVLVDSRYPEYYLAIECKSLASEGALYFKQHFSRDQIERESRFIELSGRTGVLALEFRRVGRKMKSAHLIPWTAVRDVYDSGAPCITIEMVGSYPEIPRVRGSYILNHEIIAEIYTACSYRNLE